MEGLLKLRNLIKFQGLQHAKHFMPSNLEEFSSAFDTTAYETKEKFRENRFTHSGHDTYEEAAIGVLQWAPSVLQLRSAPRIGGFSSAVF